MRPLKQLLIIICVTQICTACMSNENKSAEENSNAQQAISANESVKTKVDIKTINQRLCSQFPEDIIMTYNPDGKRLDIESVEFTAGTIAHCKIKLFHGERDYDFWEGQVGAWVSKTEDPFWQYNPERNAALYHKIDDLGEKAVFITNTYQLLILKDGVVYNIVPPNNGRMTSTGKENKAIALEIARHYEL